MLSVNVSLETILALFKTPPLFSVLVSRPSARSLPPETAWLPPLSVSFMPGVGPRDTPGPFRPYVPLA